MPDVSDAAAVAMAPEAAPPIQGGSTASFIPAERFEGAKPGYAFRNGESGNGYYRDEGGGGPAERMYSHLASLGHMPSIGASADAANEDTWSDRDLNGRTPTPPEVRGSGGGAAAHLDEDEAAVQAVQAENVTEDEEEEGEDGEEEEGERRRRRRRTKTRTRRTQTRRSCVSSATAWRTGRRACARAARIQLAQAGRASSHRRNRLRRSHRPSERLGRCACRAGGRDDGSSRKGCGSRCGRSEGVSPCDAARARMLREGAAC